MCLLVGNITDLLRLVRHFSYGFENFFILKKKNQQKSDSFLKKNI